MNTGIKERPPWEDWTVLYGIREFELRLLLKDTAAGRTASLGANKPAVFLN
jgi:hypothetical protein